MPWNVPCIIRDMIYQFINILRLWFLYELITGTPEAIVKGGHLRLLRWSTVFHFIADHQRFSRMHYSQNSLNMKLLRLSFFLKIIPITILHNKLKSKPTVTHTHSHTQISWFSTFFWKFCFQIFLQDLVLNIFIAKMYSCVDNISKISSLKHWF